jgi:excisionase family DNA binding protein
LSLNGNGLALSVPAELVEAIARQVADELAERMPDRPEPYLNVEQAAEYLAAPKSRVYDLVRDGRLTPYKDGSRSLFRREDLDAALIREEK